MRRVVGVWRCASLRRPRPITSSPPVRAPSAGSLSCASSLLAGGARRPSRLASRVSALRPWRARSHQPLPRELPRRAARRVAPLRVWAMRRPDQARPAPPGARARSFARPLSGERCRRGGALVAAPRPGTCARLRGGRARAPRARLLAGSGRSALPVSGALGPTAGARSRRLALARPGRLGCRARAGERRLSSARSRVRRGRPRRSARRHRKPGASCRPFLAFSLVVRGRRRTQRDRGIRPG